MAIEIFKCTTTLKEGVQVEVKSGKHKFLLDEPAKLGGNDTAMNPVEALLGALGACISIVARSYAEAHSIDIQDLKIKLEGDLDPDGFMSINPEAKIGFSAIRIGVHVKSSSSEEDITKFIKFVEQTCPICDTIINTPHMSTTIVVEK